MFKGRGKFMTLSHHTIQTIKPTAPDLDEHGEHIKTVVYKNIFDDHPELVNICNEANPNRGKQQLTLANMVYEAAKNIDQLEVLLEDVQLIAEKHRGLQVKPEHYPIVGKYLLLASKEEHTSELQSRGHLVCRLLLEKKNNTYKR